MSLENSPFLGTWLLAGDKHGQDFSHEDDRFDHDHADGSGTTPMRHAFVDQNGQRVGVWVPADWSDDQARDALETNW